MGFDAKSELAKTAPPVGVTALSFCGVTLSDWVCVATLIYLALQIGWLLYKISKYALKEGGEK